MKTLSELRRDPRLKIDRIGADGGRGYVHFGPLVASVIWSFGGGWEHVSVAARKQKYIPAWNDMCRIKDIFWSDEETVVQYHPAKSQYVNQLQNCLHLWKPIADPMPVPPSIMVGIRDGHGVESVTEKIGELMK